MKMAHESECSEMYYVPYVYISIHDRSSLLQLPSHYPAGNSFAPAAPAPLRVRDVGLAHEGTVCAIDAHKCTTLARVVVPTVES